MQVTKSQEHHKKESQEVSPFPNEQTSQQAKTNTHKTDPQKKHHRGMVSNKITGGLKLISLSKRRTIKGKNIMTRKGWINKEIHHYGMLQIDCI